MHLIDLIWGLLALAGAAVPAYRLYDNLHRPGAPYLLSLTAVCALYPWAYVIYPHTVFDQGFVFFFTAWIGPLYLLSVCTFLIGMPRAWNWLRNGLLAIAAGIALGALSNPLHGQFAVFKPVTALEPLSVTGQVAHGPLMSVMGGVSIACILLAVFLIGYHYSRSRFHLSQLLTMTLFPVLTGAAYLLPSGQMTFLPDRINPVILSTTTGLFVLTIALLRSRFLELRPISRELVLNLLPDAMAVIGSESTLIDCNTEFAGLLKRTVNESRGMRLNGHLPVTVWTLDDGLRINRGIELNTDGQTRYFDAHLASLDPRGRSGEVLVLLRDTTEQTLQQRQLEQNHAELEALNDELARLSTTDTLTGLRNRRYFLDELNQERERSVRLDRGFALLSIDLDDFKSVNDNYGHGIGDQALINAARAMERECRAMDTLARVGGEEFMVLLLDLDAPELEAVAERFREAIASTMVHPPGSKGFALTASIGAAFVRPGTDLATAMSQVDEALYAAKRSGRNRVVTGASSGLSTEKALRTPDETTQQPG